MAVAKSGARGPQALVHSFSGGCGAALPHHNHQRESFGEASPPQTPPEKRLCNRHADCRSILDIILRTCYYRLIESVIDRANDEVFTSNKLCAPYDGVFCGFASW